MKESGPGDAAERREMSEVIEEFVSQREWERALREIERLKQENERLC